MLNRIIDAAVRHRWLVIVLALLWAFVGVRELVRLPIDAVPDITNRQVQITTVAPALGPEEVERQVTFPLETALGGMPGLVETRSLSRHGFSQVTAVFTDSTDIWFARNLVNERLQDAREDLPGGVTPTMGPVVTGLGEVFIWTLELKGPAAAEGTPYLTPEGERLTARVDRTIAAAQGIHASDAADALAIGLAGQAAGQVMEGDRRFDVVVRLADELRNDPSVMAQLPVMPEESEPGAPTVPLSSVARFEAAEGPNQISRENGKRRIIVQANVRGRDLGGFVAEARREVAANVQPPTGGWFDWGGQFENLERASTRLALIVPLVFLTIGALLVLALRSFRDAALVFAGVPLALVGGALALAARGMPLSISAAVGFIAVSGVATLNGLVLMQAIQQRLAEGDAPVQAALTGAVSRLRAVLTTALVAVLGFIPMAFAWGPGAEVQKPLATVVIGGLTTATLLTLLVLPVLASLARKPNQPLSSRTP
jgi:Cu/Ag efflux pump CusA